MSKIIDTGKQAANISMGGCILETVYEYYHEPGSIDTPPYSGMEIHEIRVYGDITGLLDSHTTIEAIYDSIKRKVANQYL